MHDHGALNDFRLLGRSGLRISPLTLGTMTFGMDWGWGSDEKQSRQVFDMYVERGGNTLDTANNYTQGTSEKLVGQFVKGRRDEFVICTKYSMNTRPGDPNAGGNHRKNLVQAIEASLARLGTDYVDLYWIHAWDNRTKIDEIMRALDDMVHAGKVLYVGVSNAFAWQIAQANTLADFRGWAPLVAMQMQYNLVERSIEREFVSLALDFDIGIMPWAPLAAGVLSGKHNRIDDKTDADLNEALRKPRKIKDRTLEITAGVQELASGLGCSAAQLAIAWLLRKPGVVSPIIGARTPKQLEDNLGSLDVSLSDEHVRRLDEISAIGYGYPYTFLDGDAVRGYLDGGAKIERR